MTDEMIEKPEEVDEGNASSLLQEGRPIPLKWEGLENEPLHFVNNLLTQHTEHQFFLTFAHIQPPVTVDLSEEEIRSIQYVAVRPTARLAVSPGRFREFIAAMEANYQRHERRFGKKAGEG